MERFAYYIRQGSCSFKYARGESDRVGREFHAYHEIIYFLGESAVLFSEQGCTEILPHTLILVPAHTYHALEIRGEPGAYHRCLFHFPAGGEWEPIASDSMGALRVLAASPRVRELLQKLITVSMDPGQNAVAELLLGAVLTLLLLEMPREPRGPMAPVDPLTQKALERIAAGLCGPLSVERLARELNVSPSTLAHTFRASLHISVYRYIQKKRLALAAQKLALGEPAATVCMECGFKDYSNFYRQYKKEYRCVPSQKKT